LRHRVGDDLLPSSAGVLPRVGEVEAVCVLPAEQDGDTACRVIGKAMPMTCGWPARIDQNPGGAIVFPCVRSWESVRKIPEEHHSLPSGIICHGTDYQRGRAHG